MKLFSYYNPDIVFTYTIKHNLYSGATFASLYITYVVNVTGLGTAVENGEALQRITLLLYRFALRKAQKVFFQNIENLDFMLKHHVAQGADC